MPNKSELKESPRWPRQAIASGIALLIVVGMIALLPNVVRSHTSPQNGAVQGNHAASNVPTATIGPVHMAGTVIINGQVYLSTDGGAHWIKSTHEAFAGATPTTVSSRDQTSWAAWEYHDTASTTIVVARTDDGGISWQDSQLPPLSDPGAHILTFQFVDVLHGWLTVDTSISQYGQAELFATNDGGATWQSTSLPFSGKTYFASPTTGWIVGDIFSLLQDTIEMTQDGGHTWSKVHLVVPSQFAGRTMTIDPPIMFDPFHGVLPVYFNRVSASDPATPSIDVYQTVDGGQTWQTPQSIPYVMPELDSGGGLLSATFGQSGWILMGHTFIVTHDRGNTWTQINTTPANVLLSARSLAFATGSGPAAPLVGWALIVTPVCQNPKANCTSTYSLVRTTDGGFTWVSIPLPAA